MNHPYIKQMHNILKGDCIVCGNNSLKKRTFLTVNNHIFSCKDCKVEYYVGSESFTLSLNDMTLSIGSSFDIRMGTLSDPTFRGPWYAIPAFDVVFNKEILTKKLKTIFLFL